MTKLTKSIEDIRTALRKNKEGPAREEALAVVINRPFWCFKILTSCVELSSEEYSQLFEASFSWMKQHHLKEVLDSPRGKITLEQRQRITRRLCSFTTVDIGFLYWCLHGLHTYDDLPHLQATVL